MARCAPACAVRSFTDAPCARDGRINVIGLSTGEAGSLCTRRALAARDFAHLFITLCRALSTPRCCTGDLGIALINAPLDFSARSEVFLGSLAWLDAPQPPRISRIPMARGRDATDSALTTAFGRATLARFQVHTDEVASI